MASPMQVDEQQKQQQRGTKRKAEESGDADAGEKRQATKVS